MLYKNVCYLIDGKQGCQEKHESQNKYIILDHKYILMPG